MKKLPVAGLAIAATIVLAATMAGVKLIADRMSATTSPDVRGGSIHILWKPRRGGEPFLYARVTNTGDVPLNSLRIYFKDMAGKLPLVALDAGTTFVGTSESGVQSHSFNASKLSVGETKLFQAMSSGAPYPVQVTATNNGAPVEVTQGLDQVL
jgi:hypothetical protein